MTNPLSQYYRGIKHYISLPSGTDFYKESIIKFTDNGEIGIMPMTGKDEIFLKNPDALLNGEAMCEVIKSCVPAIKQPELLLTIDIDTVMVAIRRATFGPELELTMTCPECNTENSFTANLESIIDNINPLDGKKCLLKLKNGLVLMISPFLYSHQLKMLQVQFEQTKTTKILADKNLSELEKVAKFADAFKELSTLNFDIITECVVSVSDPSQDVTVTNKGQIKEFLVNIDRTVINKITKITEKINKYGITKEFNAVCKKCNHKWKSPIDFNPTNFFTDS